ncbi:MAG: phosphoenolpyruvate synthase [Candidatus Marinimicrobia bacterium]|nr:phosphoenolpyruvate synthase [Candidatus Neomarinimicrobiota bacterium]
MSEKETVVRWLEDLTNKDVAAVGGKNASLGEMMQSLKKEGVRVPPGFATTAQAYRAFIAANDLAEPLQDAIGKLRSEERSLERVGKRIRRLFRKAAFPEELAEGVRQAYRELAQRDGTEDLAVAVRSSATAEDLPDASFAGQQETFLNVTGEDDVLEACRQCYASLFTDRAIAYREEQGFDHLDVALSVGVQKMVRADQGGAGVMFSLDTETGFPDVVVITAAWGLGENIVQGAVNPDEYRVFKPVLKDESLAPIIEKVLGDKRQKMIYARGGSRTTRNVDTTKQERREFVLGDKEILQLARWACAIEQHYEKPMDMEWARDGKDGALYIVQARPETVQSQQAANFLQTYTLQEKGEVVLSGLAIGQGIGAGQVQVIRSVDDISDFKAGNILVTEMTDPDWVPVMKQAAALVTDLGGRTSHAAIVSRELGLTAVVGTGEGTDTLTNEQEVTVSCAEGDEGQIYAGQLDYVAEDVDLADLPESPVRIMMNLASPAASFRWWRLPAQGIGLARMEFIINNLIKIHPLALCRFDELEDQETRRQIETLTRGYEDKQDYFVDHLARGIAALAASQYPEPAIVRLSDFKTNEYADLIGGRQFEPEEQNPMLGFRGASRYYSDRYRDGFALECRAMKKAREELGLTNICLMIPFCRTLEEADRVLEVLERNGLQRGAQHLQIYMMCEIPSNVFLAAQFAKRFDGFSIGTNDLTQLVLGVDRDSAELAELFDERNEAVKQAIRTVIEAAHEQNCKVGICGQAPSDHPDFARFLLAQGIDSISLNPDSVIPVIRRLAARDA